MRLLAQIFVSCANGLSRVLAVSWTANTTNQGQPPSQKPETVSLKQPLAFGFLEMGTQLNFDSQEICLRRTQPRVTE